MADWFYGENGQQIGPLDEASLRDRLNSGGLPADTLVWKEGMSDWKPASSLPEFTRPAYTPQSSEGAVFQPPPVPATDSPYSSPLTDPLQAVQPVMRTQQPTSGLAIASLVCGILSLPFCCMPIIFTIPALICGHMALRDVANPDQPKQGKGMAIAGLICGYLGLVLTAAIFLVAFFTENSTSYDSDWDTFNEEVQFDSTPASPTSE